MDAASWPQPEGTASWDAPACKGYLADLQRVRNQIDRAEAAVMARLRVLADDGQAAPPSDTAAETQRISSSEARRRERRADLLGRVPELADGLAAGSIGGDHVDQLERVFRNGDEHAKAGLLARADALRARAERTSPTEFGRHCRQVADQCSRQAGVDRDRRQRRDTFLSHRIDPTTGMHRLRGELHPTLGHRIWAAITAEADAAMTARTGAPHGSASVGGDDPLGHVPRSEGDRSRLAAEALGRLVASGNQAVRPAATEVSVLIDLDTLLDRIPEPTTGARGADDGPGRGGVCELDDGTPIAAETARRLACSAGLIPVVLGGAGQPLDVGRARRLATAAQRRALRARHATCAVATCDVAFDRCEIHHLLPWDHGGPTDLANLRPLCSAHHHRLHEGRWSARLRDDGGLDLEAPNAPPGTAPSPRRPPAPPHAPPCSTGAPTADPDDRTRRRRPDAVTSASDTGEAPSPASTRSAGWPVDGASTAPTLPRAG